MDVVPLTDADPSTQCEYKDTYTDQFDTFEHASEVAQEEAMGLVEGETQSHTRFQQIDCTIHVDVQKKNYRTAPFMATGPKPATCWHGNDIHVITIDSWILDNVSEEIVRGIIRHELCHAVMYEQYGDHGEHDPMFEALLDETDGLEGGDPRAREEVWDRIPRSRVR